MSKSCATTVFKVVEVSRYESLFRMVAINRFDLFCRGTNELLEEFNAHRDIPDLTYDEAISIAYPMPRFSSRTSRTRRRLSASRKDC